MMLRQMLRNGVLSLVASTLAVSPGYAQTSETFSATAAVKTAGAATASAPVTVVVDRKMPQAEADQLVGAFKAGGPAALRKALVGVAPTGTVQLGVRRGDTHTADHRARDRQRPAPHHRG